MLIKANIEEVPTVLPVIREPKTWHPVIVAGALRKVVNGLFDAYRPELHYMRGPGPRWHAKHDFDLSKQGRG